MPRLILASTSRYRHDLLSRLRLPFETAKPQVDETPRTGEMPAALAERLAATKASAITADGADTWVIGSDQVAELNDSPLGKPHTTENAISQLTGMAGNSVVFHTAIALRGATGTLRALDRTQVDFRQLTRDEIERYVATEQPLDCAGSFKCEGLGISLFEAIHTTDPTALIGLPLIALSRLLREAGFTLP